MEDIKLAFIAQALNEYSQQVVAEMKRRITSYKAVDTRTLLHSLSYNVYQDQAQGNSSLSFAEWGRFLDMGVTKSNPLGGVKASTAALTGQKNNTVKPRKLYSPVAYGKLNWLIGELVHGFTEETILKLKSQLQASNV